MSIPIKRKPGTVKKPLSTQKSSPTVRDIEGPSDQSGACSDVQNKATPTRPKKVFRHKLKSVQKCSPTIRSMQGPSDQTATPTVSPQ